MNFIVLPQAADEFEDAVTRYDEKEPGLGGGSETRLIAISAGLAAMLRFPVCGLMGV